MSIRTLPLVAFVTVIALTIAHGATETPADQELKADGKTTRASSLISRLEKRVSLQKPFEGRFRDALELLAEQYDLPIVLDPALREFAGGAQACDGLEDKMVKLPKMLNVRADTLLRLTCEQADAMFLVYPDYIRIVPTVFALYETGVTAAGLDPTDEQPSPLTADQLLKTRPLIKRAIVNLSFKEVSVANIVDEIAAASGANVILAPLDGRKAEEKLTVRFANTPVDAAVRTVCEMAELGLIEDANVLLVTSPERAAERRKLDLEKKKARMLSLAGPNIGFCANNQVLLPTGIGGEGTDYAAQLARLKEQNEQLKKQLDEVMKLLKK
jgi:hypothetical protein